jgi:hypothetical protein
MGASNSNGNCYMVKWMDTPDGPVLLLRDYKEFPLLGVRTPTYQLTEPEVKTLRMFVENDRRLTTPRFFTTLSTPFRIELKTLTLKFLPNIGVGFPRGMHSIFFGEQRGPTFSAAETAPFFRHLAEDKPIHRDRWTIIESAG